MSQALLLLSLAASAAAAWQLAAAWALWRERRLALARAAGTWRPDGQPRGLGAGRAGLRELMEALGQSLEAWQPLRAQALNARLQRVAGASAPGAGLWALQGLAWGLGGLFVLGLLDAGPYAFLGLGFALMPVIRLRDQEAKRRLDLRLGLPDALDLLCTCVQAGLGLDQSLERTGQQLPAGPLREEWLRMLEQLRSGATRKLAFEHWDQRCQTEDLGPVLRAILRSEQRGVALSPALLASADQLRRLRSLRIQEQAARAPIKMLLPLMLFFLPAVFLVLFGPIVMKLTEIGF